MIALVDSESESDFFSFQTNDIFSAKIVSDYELYGCNLKYTLFYIQTEKEKVIGIISKIDNVITYSCENHEYIEEVLCFFKVIGYKMLLCDKALSQFFSNENACGDILLYDGKNNGFITNSFYTDSEDLLEVYYLICLLHEIKPEFSSWFTDMSLKLRSNKASLSILKCDNQIVSCAFVFYLSSAKGLISGVSTLESYKGRGYATECINKILSDNKLNEIYIFTNNAQTTLWYQKMGFKKQGFWCEINGICL